MARSNGSTLLKILPCLPPKSSHNRLRRDFVPRLSLFSKVGYYKTPDLFWREYSLSRIFTDLIMHNHRSNQSALMTRFGTDLRHQYGIFGGKSHTSFSRNATRAGSEEGRMFSQAILCFAECY